MTAVIKSEHLTKQLGGRTIGAPAERVDVLLKLVGLDETAPGDSEIAARGQPVPLRAWWTPFRRPGRPRILVVSQRSEATDLQQHQTEEQP